MKNTLYTDLFINSNWVKTAKKFDVNNPATGELIAKLSFAGDEEIELAIASACNAFKLWKTQTAAFRSAKLYDWYNIIV